MQFILTTHAPIVILSVRARNLGLLDEGGIVYPSEETYGGNIGQILQTVMCADERPNAVQDRFDAFYEELDAGEHDAAEAELKALCDLIGSSDPDVVAAQTALFLTQL